MRIRIGIIGLLLILFLVLWFTSPSSPWSNEGFVQINNTLVRGRYIRLENKQVGCMNLSGIEVYSSKDGKNILGPNTKSTKSSPHGNDNAPNSNLFDGNPDTIVHTSCREAPWLVIDLGSVVPIYKIVITNRKDCCKQRANGIILSILDNNNTTVFVANPIRDKKRRITYEENTPQNTNHTDYFFTFTYFPPYPVPFGDLSPTMTLDPPSTIDSITGWSPNSPHMNPTDMIGNETVESCRQRAINGNYVAWGYRKDNHPSPEWKNTCYLYTGEMKPYIGNPTDDIHLTGCLHPGEKIELGCKLPSDPTSYQSNDRLKCRTLNTPFNDEGGGNAVFLDRHNVNCEPDELLKQFHLIRSGNNSYRYNYTCCKITSPQFSEDSLPSHIKTLPDQLSRIQNTIQTLQNDIKKPIQASSLPTEIKDIPTKLSAIQAEVKNIQSRLQTPVTDTLPSDLKDTPVKIALIQADLKQMQQKLSNPTLPLAVQQAPTKLAEIQTELKQIQEKLNNPSLPKPIQDAPTKLTEVQTELKQIQQKLSQPSLPPAIQEAPTKLAALEGEVQRIQQQLQKASAQSPSVMYQSSPAPTSSAPIASPSLQLTQSAPNPVREDIVPENRLSEIGTTALQLGNQSSLLRDIQQIIRNEIYADRATTPLLEGFF